MGIYIKGIDMPQDDEMLCLNVFPDGKVTWHFDLKCKPLAIATGVSTPHGRLIDADKAVSDYAKYGKSHFYDATDLEDILAECPTIIESEE